VRNKTKTKQNKTKQTHHTPSPVSKFFFARLSVAALASILGSKPCIFTPPTGLNTFFGAGSTGASPSYSSVTT
jgi:hypothetical protein